MLQKFDPRNQDVWVYVKDQLVPRRDAKVSVLDSVVQGGDAVWEGLRVYPEGIMLLDRHLGRLFDSAKAMHFQHIPSREEILNAIRLTLEKNGMTKDTHIRLTLTRGEKITSGMDPRLNQFGSTLIVLAEWKPPVYDNDNGITVFTSAIRRNSPTFLDSKIHHNNLINNILAKIHANIAGKDAALMLDNYGFAAELNGTNIFMIKNDQILTPHADACLHGITRGFIFDLARQLGLQVTEKNISLTELYTADAVFCTGTMGELTPISEIDERVIPMGHPIFNELAEKFEKAVPQYCIPILQ